VPPEFLVKSTEAHLANAAECDYCQVPQVIRLAAQVSAKLLHNLECPLNLKKSLVTQDCPSSKPFLQLSELCHCLVGLSAYARFDDNQRETVADVESN
jgi:hypothetical protein